MTENETDPQRRPAPTDAEPAQPTAELPRVGRGPSDSPAVEPAAPAVQTAPATPGTSHAGHDAPAGHDSPAGHAGHGAPAGHDAAFVGSDAAPAPVSASAPEAAPAMDAAPAGPGSVPAAGQHPYGGYAQPAATPSAPPYPVSGHPQPAGQYPTSPWQQGQQSGWTGGAQHQPGYVPHAGGPAYPGGPFPPHQPGQPVPPQHAGQPVPPWAQGPAARPSRIAKLAGAGVAVFALMLGSGVAGGALALALDSGGVTRTYSAAPVINSADLPKIAASVQDSVVSITTGSGEGSGVILSGDGYVLTNNHVVASASGDTVRVVFADGRQVEAKIIGTDPKTDLAVVQAKGVSGLKAAKFGDSDAMQVGDQVLALGSPLGLQGSVTAGILSARDRTIQAGSGQQQDPRQGASSISGLLQTDAPINPGNSGGALVNTRGEVIGINTAIATSGQSTGNIGVGFAIPSNKAKDVASKLQRGEKVSHPSLGVSVTAAENGGAVVASVTPGSPAEKAGLRQGDVITRFGDTVINDSDDLVGAVQSRKVGDRVEVQYQRNGSPATATVTLAETS
ncbi:trypsin-like peptidase domain-containing protein [Micromonospora olivasterospora]|uniref:Putative serine protease PepD n=1 Tax=Micromonospora olivasterospora TaxID=1880 RepID=A0A562I6K2_MICOL|nr:trypsin-like peptidase domain-containing protein [Micromonospora olivasterospora]TWH66345.1 putative serine protease PepD [Micromonospora olivasterospora]